MNHPKSQNPLRVATVVALLTVAGVVTAQAATNLNPTNRVIYPAKNQSADQQKKDQQKCYDWAKTNSSVDPVAAQEKADTQIAQAQQTANAQIAQAQQTAASQTAQVQQPQSSAVRGAARGALVGVAAGAIAGDAGQGAAIGAAAGGLAGGMRRRDQAAAAQQQQQQAAAAQQQATQSAQQQSAAAQQKAKADLDAAMAKWDKAFGTCLDGNGYSVN